MSEYSPWEWSGRVKHSNNRMHQQLPPSGIYIDMNTDNDRPYSIAIIVAGKLTRAKGPWERICVSQRQRNNYSNSFNLSLLHSPLFKSLLSQSQFPFLFILFSSSNNQRWTWHRHHSNNSFLFWKKKIQSFLICLSCGFRFHFSLGLKFWKKSIFCVYNSCINREW